MVRHMMHVWKCVIARAFTRVIGLLYLMQGLQQQTVSFLVR
jgi:hypothetical protein